MYGPWTPELDAKLRHLLVEQGASARAAGQALGRTPGACNLRAKKLGISRLNRHDWSEAETARLRSLVATTGLSIRAMADALGRTEHSVRWKLEQLGLCRGKDPWTPEQVAILRRMRAGNASYEAIAAATGRGPGSVADKARALGIGEAARRRWTADDVDALRRAVAAGQSAEDVAARSNRPAAAVMRKAHMLGTPFPPRGGSRMWTPADDATLRGIVEADGGSDPARAVARAAERLGRPVRGVRIRAARLGLLDIRARPPLDEAVKARILALAAEGVPITRAAALVDRDVRTLRRVAGEAGMSFRRERRRRAAPEPARTPDSGGRAVAPRDRAAVAKVADRTLAAERRRSERAEAARLARDARARERAEEGRLRREERARQREEQARLRLEAKRAEAERKAEARAERARAASQARTTARGEAARPAAAPRPEAPVPAGPAIAAPALPPARRPNWLSGFFARRPAGSAAGAADRDAALAIRSEVADDVARFLAKRGVTRERLDPAEAVVRGLRRRGYAVVRHGDGYLIDGRTRLAGFPDLVDFARARSVEIPDLPMAAE